MSKTRYIFSMILLVLVLVQCEKPNLDGKNGEQYTNNTAKKGEKDKLDELAREGSDDGSTTDSSNDKFDLVLQHVSLPDTVQMGSSVIIRGQLLNQGQGAYVGEPMELHFLVSEQLSTNPTITNSDFGQDIVPHVTVIPPQQWLDFEHTISITQQYFQRETKNAIVFWPMGTNSGDDADLDNNFAKREVYVRD